ncbi:hypothetical protein POSPLADRAFT_1159842, partial [Postia placenta MAD-698-R-SB12]
ISSFKQFHSNECRPRDIVGVFLNWGLHGALCVQMLYILFCAEWVFTILLSMAVFALLLDNAVSPTYYEVSSTIFYFVIPVLSALIAAMVQVFYAWRMWLLSNRKLLILAGVVGWLGGSALVDIIIAVAMYILLRKLRRGEQESDILLNRLVKHVVGSGMVTGNHLPVTE